MSADTEQSTTVEVAPTLIPESWPPADPVEPVRTVRVHWMLALPASLLAALFPRRMGPHLAASSWTAAYVAHVLSIWIAVGAAFAFVFTLDVHGREGVEIPLLVNPFIEVRRALAGIVLLAYGLTSNWTQTIAIVIVAAVIEAIVWLGPVLLIPLYAAGEGRRRTYLRGVKLLLWSTGTQIPIFWLFVRLIERYEIWRHESWILVTLFTFELWYLTVVWRLGGRCGGSKDGPRWQVREPRCEVCGYSLVSLPLDGRCPECAEAVANSLPQRRRPPAFAAARGPVARFTGFLSTTWHAMFARRFARSVTVWGHHRVARNYAALMCLFVGSILTVIAVAFQGIATRNHTGYPEAPSPVDRSIVEFLANYENLGIGIVIGIGGGLGVLAWMLLVGLFLSRFGWRDMADRVVILCYSTASLLVPLLLAIVGAAAAYATMELCGPLRGFHVPQAGWISWEAVIWSAWALPFGVALIWSFLRMREMLREARYANA